MDTSNTFSELAFSPFVVVFSSLKPLSAIRQIAFLRRGRLF
jgi:hypothetical protein